MKKPILIFIILILITSVYAVTYKTLPQLYRLDRVISLNQSGENLTASLSAEDIDRDLPTSCPSATAIYGFGDNMSTTFCRSTEDGLGNHTASEALNMSGNSILDTSTISTTSGAALNLNPSGNLFVYASDILLSSTAPSYILAGSDSGTIGSIKFRRSGAIQQAIIQSEGQKIQFVIGVDDLVGNAVLIVDEDEYSEDYDHPVYSNPHLCVQSGTSPDTDNTQYGCLSHNTNNFNLNTGKGNFTIQTNLTVDNDLYVKEDLLALGDITANGDITAINYYGNGDTLDNIVANPVTENINFQKYNTSNMSYLKSEDETLTISFEGNTLVIKG